MRRRRVVWAGSMAFIAASVFALGSARLQRTGAPDSGSGQEQTPLEVADLVVETAYEREDTCALLRCSTEETDEGLTFTVHR